MGSTTELLAIPLPRPGAAHRKYTRSADEVIKDMPFSAKVVTESTQTLVDSNRIVRKSAVFIARDSEGRTRREQKLVGTDASILFMLDPVAEVSYVLDTRAGSIRKTPIQTVETVEAPVNSAHDAESLGTQIIEGFLAEGTRLRRTIPADKADSDRPLEVITESWYSPQLQTIVMNRTVDPRIGEVIYKLTDIQLGEPAQSLFEIPKDYTVQEDTTQAFRRLVIQKSKNK